jgi:nucleotide-binding universal stress UspA family protein
MSYERAMVEGFPHGAIPEYSTVHDIDLAVVDVSDRSGLTEDGLGSTTDRVAQSAETSAHIARS